MRERVTDGLKVRLAAAIVCLCLPAFSRFPLPLSIARAGWVGDVTSTAVKGIGGRALDEAAAGACDRAKVAISERVDGGEPDFGRTAPPSSPNPSDVRVERMDRGEAVTAEAIFALPDEFVPGDRTLFFDDFSDTDAGEFPRRWTLEGPVSGSGYTPIEVVRHKGETFVRYRRSNVEGIARSLLFPRIEMGKDMPSSFTVEFDALFPPKPKDLWVDPEYRLLLINGATRVDPRDPINDGYPNVISIGSLRAVSAHTRADHVIADSQIHHVAIRVSGTFAKVYVDGDRVVNDPDAVVRPVTSIGMVLTFQNGPAALPLMFTNFRVAAEGKESGRTPVPQAAPREIRGVR